MPHSNFKERSHTFNSGVGMCPYVQTFDFVSEGDWDMKFQMHRDFCSKLAEGSKHIRTPKKAVMLKEQQNNDAERIQRVHKNN